MPPECLFNINISSIEHWQLARDYHTKNIPPDYADWAYPRKGKSETISVADYRHYRIRKKCLIVSILSVAFSVITPNIFFRDDLMLFYKFLATKIYENMRKLTLGSPAYCRTEVESLQ